MNINNNDNNLKDNNQNDNNLKDKSDTNKLFILKISGIWETKESVGLTFKIILVNKQFNNLFVFNHL